MSDFEEYHAELRAVAHDLLRPFSPLSAGGRPPDRVDARVLARSGWLGLEVPVRLDGAGATFSEVAVILDEMGGAAALSPYLGSAVLGIGLLNLLEPSPAADDLLRRAGAGEARLAVALDTGDDVGSTAAFVLRASAAGGWLLSGEAGFVPDAGDADTILVLAAVPGGGLAVVPVAPGTEGLKVTDRPVVDSTRRLATVTAERLDVPEASVWQFGQSAEASAWRLFDRGALALACDSLGLAEAVMRATVSYAGTRRQFGRPIGSFQAVKHACADMLVRLSIGRELVAGAVDAQGRGREDAWIRVSQAKSYMCEAAVEVAGKAMQLHGGIGYTWESGIHSYLKRALLNRSLFGSPGWHRRRLASRYG